jgi:hypothetical protein
MDVFSNQYEYLRAETPEGGIGSAVFKRDINLSGDAGSLELNTVLPAPPGSNPVETTRKQLYGAYGRLWIALPLMFITLGLSSAYQVNAGYSSETIVKANVYKYVSWGSIAAFGLTLTETFYRIYQYSNISGKNTAPIVK